MAYYDGGSKPTREYSRVPAVLRLAAYKINQAIPKMRIDPFPIEPDGYWFGGLAGMREENKKKKEEYKRRKSLWRNKKSRPSRRDRRDRDSLMSDFALGIGMQDSSSPRRRRSQNIVAETSSFPIAPSDPLQDIANSYAERYKAAYAAMDQTADDGHHNRKGGFVKRNGKSFWRRSTKARNPKKRP
jgi:hypothetical protein